MSALKNFLIDHEPIFWWISIGLGVIFLIFEAITWVFTFKRTNNRFVLITTALMIIGGIAKMVNNLNHLSRIGTFDLQSPVRKYSVWAWRYIFFLAHWNLALHYYTASVTCTEIF